MHSEVRDATVREASALLDAVHKNNTEEVVRLVCEGSSFGPAILWKNVFDQMTTEEQAFARSAIDTWAEIREAELDALNNGEWPKH